MHDSQLRQHGGTRALTRGGARLAGGMTLCAAALAGIAGGALTGYMRLVALSRPLDTAPWQALVTAHGLVMLFFAAIPALIGGIGMLALPGILGTRDIAFPRLAVAAAALQGLATALALAALAAPGAAVESAAATTLGSFALHLSGIAMLGLAAVAITSILTHRAPDRRLSEMPVLGWALLAANAMVLMSMPVLAAAIVHLGGPVTQPGLGWVFGHPAILMVVLPALGLAAQGIEAETGRPLAGRRTVAATMLAATGIGFFVWAGRLFSEGLGPDALAPWLGALCIGGPVLAVLLAALSSLRHGPGSGWSVALTLLMAAGLTGTVALALAGREVTGLMHQTIGLGAAFAVMAVLNARLGPAAGRLGRGQFALMAAGAVLLLTAEIFGLGRMTTAGALLCLAGAALAVPLILRLAGARTR